MADGQQARPSFKHTVVKKALAPIVATAATAATTYLMRKAAELWQEQLQPKVEEKGGAEALARQAGGAVSSKLSAGSKAVTSKAGGDESERPEPAQETPDTDGDRSEERRKREQRRKQRAKELDQARTS
jgi:hypothetical protein